jgi:ubiquinone/menaquinone biosynthesis C-methylase UbiE
MSTQTMTQPTPMLFFETVNAYQRTEALKAAIQLETFTAIGEGNATAAAIAARCGTSERGMRILCDFLCMIGLITKEEQDYALTPDSAVFLDKRSPAYLGGATEFLLSPPLLEGFSDFTGAVRKGGTIVPDDGTIAPENPVWVKFARAMAPMMAMPAQVMAKLVDPEGKQPLKVLDIAAGHGLFGQAFAQNNPQAQVVALDWPKVLEVAKENARRTGVEDRFSTLEGSAFSVDFGVGYDLVLLTNFLHHFDPETCESLLRKVHGALSPSGRAITLEFVPNDDRVSPPGAASFSVIMLASTPAGDAYTFKDLERMFAAAGFNRSEIQPLLPSVQSVVTSYK